ncbi:MAG: alpha/beta fold hydrolase [Conexibacter sp.]
MEPLELDVDGRRLEGARLRGDAGRRPLVLLHEGLGSVALWRDFPAQLHAATGRDVLSFSRFGHGHSEPPPRPRTPAFFHEEALEVLPAVLAQAGASAPLLIGHSDGASIALIHAAHHDVAGVALLAPHVFVEDVTVAAIEQVRARYVDGDLRGRLARHHADPDAAFWGWCDVWLDPAFRAWTLDEEAARLHAPALLVQGVEDAYGSLAQLDRIEAAAPRPPERLHVPGGHNPHLEAPEATLAAIVALQAALP